MAAPAAEQAPAAGAAAGGGQSAQLLQQVSTLLTQLAQEQSDPQVQQAVKQLMPQVTALEGIVGGNDEQSMQSGLHNPGGAPPEEAPGGAAAATGAAPPEGGGGGEHHVVEVHIGVPSGGPKDFGSARKAAMAFHGEHGSFDPSTPKGETPSSQKTKNKAKG